MDYGDRVHFRCGYPPPPSCNLQGKRYKYNMDPGRDTARLAFLDVYKRLDV